MKGEHGIECDLIMSAEKNGGKTLQKPNLPPLTQGIETNRTKIQINEWGFIEKYSRIKKGIEIWLWYPTALYKTEVSMMTFKVIGYNWKWSFSNMATDFKIPSGNSPPPLKFIPNFKTF